MERENCFWFYLQEHSKPNQSLICGSKQEDILKSILKIIDDTYSDNHNVSSRNGEHFNRQLMELVLDILKGLFDSIFLSFLRVRS